MCRLCGASRPNTGATVSVNQGGSVDFPHGGDL